GAFVAGYYDYRFPLAPKSWPVILEPASRALGAQLGESAAEVQELESILTAIAHLPARHETEPARVQERMREKEVIKRRLLALVEASAAAREAVEASLTDINGRRGEPRSFDRLEALLAEQPYRLSYWRVASDEINFRRFFDVNELAAIRVEDPAVFEAVHSLPRRLVEEGLVQGLRIDHVDGLYDPLDYLRRLPSAAYVLVEKILVGDERLRTDWPVHGTTGYEMLNRLNGLFVEPSAGPALLDLYRRFTGTADPFPDVAYECRKLVMDVALSSELTVLARRLDRISEQHRFSRDFTLNTLQAALAEVIACFPVYRSYLRPAPEPVGAEDRRHVTAAVRLAKRRNPALDASLFDFLASVLLGEDPEGLDEALRAERREFAIRVQQLTSPVMAKGIEDTAFYRYVPLASLNEVGGEPEAFGLPLERFHLEALERARHWPHALTATSTHDTKRDEDVRARIDVLSEVPRRWEEAVLRWRDLNRAHHTRLEDEDVPAATDEYLFYQTLVGALPPGRLEEASLRAFVPRLQEYLRKALREAKVRTSWVRPDAAYEEAVLRFVETCLDPQRGRRFLEDVAGFLEGVLRPGLLNAVSQVVLKVGLPGVPDFYQGTEIPAFSLVDPDNRRPVDFERRREALRSLDEEASDAVALAGRLLARPEDGRLKLFVTSRALRFRRALRELFAAGDYVPLHAVGVRQREVVAFARTVPGSSVVVAAARFLTRLPDPPIGASAWGDTALALAEPRGRVFRDAFTGRDVRVARSERGDELPLADAFAHLPVALLEAQDG
ncbi:MAG TPA: malto-oligosyltrehalose synthase, partial [Vicinamibacteria bacterium]|nr:malto-oligosyltrehalose synthase [Vicinamibacteria bacterium]